MHPKVGMLASMLGIRRFEAVGVLEMLWHFTAQYCPQGDVGKRTDTQIAAFLDWPQDRATVLVEALVSCAWLDRNDEHRLVVHDWHDHSDGTCDKYLAEHGLKYATSRDPRRSERQKAGPSRDKSRQVATSRDSRACARVPEPEPEPEPSPKPPVGGCDARGLHASLVGTGKFPALVIETVMAEMAKFPRAKLTEEKIAEWAAAAASMPTGAISHPAPWIRARLSELEVAGLEKKERPASRDCGENGPLIMRRVRRQEQRRERGD
jgi:hypothetical protein